MRTALAVAVVATLLPGPRVPAAQAQGVGEVSFPNSGAPAAQAPFLAGLAQLHNFEYASAADLFRKAQLIDPGFAMAHWGEAMTYNHPVWMEQVLSAARKALERLAWSRERRAAAAKTAREKDYLRAVEILYGEGAKPDRDLAYASAMADLYRAYPEDPDAAAFYALALLGTAHAGRDFGIYEFGPPAIDKPSRELLGELLLSQGKPVEARVAFEQALARTPERTASLRGLLRAAVTSGDTHKATRYVRGFAPSGASPTRFRKKSAKNHGRRPPAQLSRQVVSPLLTRPCTVSLV